MPNGKPGDHPLTDLLTHGLPVYTERVDELLRDVARLYEHRAWRELYALVDKYDRRNPGDLEQLERELYARRAQLRDGN
jgi:hypothetical protein